MTDYTYRDIIGLTDQQLMEEAYKRRWPNPNTPMPDYLNSLEACFELLHNNDKTYKIQWCPGRNAFEFYVLTQDRNGNTFWVSSKEKCDLNRGILYAFLIESIYEVQGRKRGLIPCEQPVDL